MGFQNANRFKTPEIAYILDWNQRAICLDDIIVEDGHLIAGLKIVKEISKDSNMSPCLKLSVRSTPFNITTGELYNTRSVWLNNNTIASKKRTDNEITFEEPGDIPILFGDNQPHTGNGQFFKFTTSDLRKDADQNVIPFIDIQRVESVNLVPISGVGLIHKGEEGSGGFLSFKITTLDITQLLDAKKKQ